MNSPFNISATASFSRMPGSTMESANDRHAAAVDSFRRKAAEGAIRPSQASYAMVATSNDEEQDQP